jgi:hypothetical protein
MDSNYIFMYVPRGKLHAAIGCRHSLFNSKVSKEKNSK